VIMQSSPAVPCRSLGVDAPSRATASLVTQVSTRLV